MNGILAILAYFGLFLGPVVAQIRVYDLQTAYCEMMEGSGYFQQYKLATKCHHRVKIFSKEVSMEQSNHITVLLILLSLLQSVTKI